MNKLNRFTLTAFALMLSTSAMAVTISCPTESGVLVYDSATQSLQPQPGVASAPSVSLTRVPMRSAFTAQSQTGGELASFSFGGHPLKPDIKMDQNGKTYSCTAQGDVSSMYEQLIDDDKTKAVIAHWNNWATHRPIPCDPKFDSVGYFQPNGNGKMAIVFHGFSVNPVTVLPEIRMLLDAGYNVIAPRLSGHFDYNYLDLAGATKEQWIRDAENALSVARRSGKQVVLVGYSLGGTLASMLAIEHPQAVSRLILFAPAWRLSTQASAGVFFGYNTSLNEYEHTAPSCKLGFGYSPGKAGQKVEALTSDLEMKYHGTFPGIINSAYAAIRVPTMVLTTPGDGATDVDFVQAICADFARNSGSCVNYSIAGRTHSNIVSALNAKIQGGVTIRQVITQFLN